MASKPGILTEWPWTPLGNFKYIVLAPWVVDGIYRLVTTMTMKEEERSRENSIDLGYMLIFPFLLWRMLHNQIWISLSRYRTAKSKNRILDRSIEFEQVDRERNWDDQIIFNGVLFYLGIKYLPAASHLPLWRSDGVILTILLHTGPVEFLYYWLHRALHHHYLYSRYHSHHHSSIVTEPITSVIHPFGEHISYFILFAIPTLTTVLTGTASIVAVAGYLTYIDFMNNMGHCNFELVPNFVFDAFPLIKYFFYTPSYHSLHHTQFRTNYALFMPMYDYIYSTMDKSSEVVYETSLKRQDEAPHVVHLTHLTTPDSIYHLRLGFASIASGPYISINAAGTSKWYMWILWPVTLLSLLVNWLFTTSCFVVERNTFDNKLKLQTWAIPRYIFQYNMSSQREEINRLIEEAILEADEAGVKVLSLGLLNQGEELNGNGELYIQKHPKLKIRVVDGSSLAVALVLNSIPKGTNQLLLRGNLSKVAYQIVLALCAHKGIQVVTINKDEYGKIKQRFGDMLGSNLILSTSYAHLVWLVGDGLSEKEEMNAPEGTHFIPFSQFPPMKKVRKDCVYYNTPSMTVPLALENMDSCENWLPRRVISAWRVAGIVHTLEEWSAHECHGILTEWPWTPLGNFKYIVLAPWILDGIYRFITTMTINEEEKSRENIVDPAYLLIFPLLLWRMLHNQIWISLSRHRTAKSKNRILDRSIEYEQVDRERNWDDQIILNGVLFYLASKYVPEASHLPLWRTDGFILTILLHTGPVEFLYYWLHRALHHHYLYSRYHSHHHSSVVTEPITSVIHPFGEHIMYFLLFAIPVSTLVFTGTASQVVVAGYITYIDFMNNMGHCNFEVVPNYVFDTFPLIKYFFYTPSYHSLHHTQFRTNYALFMPMYDYIYGTMDKSSDVLYETSLERQDEAPHVVHLTHLTTPDSIYHLRLGFASLASGPYNSTSTAGTSKWYMWMLWPVTLLSVLFNWLCITSCFVVERNTFDNKLKLQTWAIPRYSFQYNMSSQRGEINGLIEEAILEADEAGVKVLSLGLLNQGEELNGNGELYVQKHPKLKIRVVDGTSLAVALVLNSIPKGTNQLLLRGKLSKVAYQIVFALCTHKGIQVVTVNRNEYKKLKLWFGDILGSNLILSTSYAHQVWLVGDGLSEKEERNAPEGTHFIPFSQFPPMKKVRKDCVYYNTPAMTVPPALENMDSCENWLPRRVMSAWRVAGIVHAMEEWDVHECHGKYYSSTMSNLEKIWVVSLRHGFRPLDPMYT